MACWRRAVGCRALPAAAQQADGRVGLHRRVGIMAGLRESPQASACPWYAVHAGMQSERWRCKAGRGTHLLRCCRDDQGKLGLGQVQHAVLRRWNARAAMRSAIYGLQRAGGAWRCCVSCANPVQLVLQFARHPALHPQHAATCQHGQCMFQELQQEQHCRQDLLNCTAAAPNVACTAMCACFRALNCRGPTHTTPPHHAQVHLGPGASRQRVVLTSLVFKSLGFRV